MKLKAPLLLSAVIMTSTVGLSFQSVVNAEEVVKVKETIDYSQVIEDYSDVERYAAILEKYELEHPIATPEELDSFLSVEMGKELRSKFNSNKTYRASKYDSVPYVTDMLNAKEKEVFNSNKSYGLKALVAGQKAKEYSEAKYESGSLHNGNGDAFRHILWNTYMRNYTTKAYAEKFATAHEEGSIGQPAIEKKMDLYNNSVGRDLTFNNSGSYGDLAGVNVVQKAVDGGKGQRISKNKLVDTNSGGKK
ncbi:DUF6973 domain-containing protein [Bacillus sp. JJ722]|uniref:DUF6973 domain-containing protein n=1 Tax=Bacillus sp. JJ722 TaxID=3122973 RepID=UPI002FFEA141